MRLDCLSSDSDVLVRNGPTAGTAQQETRGHICAGKVPKFSLIGKEWKYRGEGNGSLVLAILKAKKIVRITKVDKDGRSSFRDAGEVRCLIRSPCFPVGSWDETVEKLHFSNKVMGRMLGACLVKEGQLRRIDECDADMLVRTLPALRPANRIHKQLNPAGLVVLYPDCTLVQSDAQKEESSFPTYCVEIKPKQGFKSSASHNRCPFCLNQFLKAKNGKIARRSSYCPLDLFSGSYKRMVRAAKELIRTPQNNLRIFKDGELVLSEENSVQAQAVLNGWLHPDSQADQNGHSKESVASRSFLNFAHLIVQALTTPLPEEITPSTAICLPISLPHNQIRDSPLLPSNEPAASILDPCETRMESLPKNCLLDRLLRIQKLGEIEADGLYEAYDTVAQELGDTPGLIDRLHWSHRDYDDIAWIVEDHARTDIEKSLKAIQRYRILATARDCSIMIIFKQVATSDGVTGILVTDLEGRSYQCQISVVDLDPKPITCILKHRRRERSMTEAYCQAVRESEAE